MSRDDHERSTYQIGGGHRLDGTTRTNLIDTYDLKERGGWLFWIDAHQRLTAKLVESRYNSMENTEANVWSGHYVAVWTSDIDTKNDIEDMVPQEEIKAIIRGV